MISAQLGLRLNQQKENICKNVLCLWNNELGSNIIVTHAFLLHIKPMAICLMTRPRREFLPSHTQQYNQNMIATGNLW